MIKTNTIRRRIRTSIDLRPAERVEVRFSQKDKTVLIKSGDSVAVTENLLTVILDSFDSLLFESGRLIAIEIVAYYDNGSHIASNLMYRPFNGFIEGGDCMNAYFGEVNIVASQKTVEEIAEELSEEVDGKLSEKVDKVEGMGLSENSFTTAEKTKLSGIEYGAEANVQSDWDEEDSDSDAFIQNRKDLAASNNNGTVTVSLR